jgi:hypothetical protein
MDDLKKMTNQYLIQSYAVEVLNLQYRTEQRDKALLDELVSPEEFEDESMKLNSQQEKNNAFVREILRRMK